MKRKFFVILAVLVLILCLSACSDNSIDDADVLTEESSELFEDEGVFEEQTEVTLFANGGTIWFGAEEPYDAELSVSAMDVGVTIAEAIGEEIHSIEKENAEFAGWTVYSVNNGEWVEEEATDLADGQLCVACGDYGFYLMSEYELVGESVTTDDLLTMECDGQNVYAIANWK